MNDRPHRRPKPTWYALLLLAAFCLQACATCRHGTGPYVFGLSQDAIYEGEQACEPVHWVRTQANDLPYLTVLAFEKEVPGGSAEPPEHWLRLRVAAHGMPPGAIIGWDGGPENPNPDLYDLIDRAATRWCRLKLFEPPAGSIEAKQQEERIRGVGHIPPAVGIAQTPIQGGSIGEGRYSYDGRLFYELRPAEWPRGWTKNVHAPKSDCDIPRDPIYGRLDAAQGVAPGHWWIRRSGSAALKLPLGLMFGSESDRADYLPGNPPYDYVTRPYGEVEVKRWLVRR